MFTTDQSIKRAVWIAALAKGGPVWPMSWKDFQLYKSIAQPANIMILPRSSFRDAYSDSYWEVYGGYPLFHRSMVEDLLNNLNSGIDWYATSTIEDSTETEFQGTFSNDREIPVLRGELFLNNGKIYPGMANLEISLSGLSEVLMLIKKYDNLSDEEILMKLENKLKVALEDSKKEDYVLSYALRCKHSYKNLWD